MPWGCPLLPSIFGDHPAPITFTLIAEGIRIKHNSWMSCSHHGISSASTSVAVDGYPHGKAAAVLATRSHSPGIISQQGPDLRTSPTHSPDVNTSQQDIQVSSKSELRIIDIPIVREHSSSNESLTFSEAKHHLPNAALNERKQRKESFAFKLIFSHRPIAFGI